MKSRFGPGLYVLLLVLFGFALLITAWVVFFNVADRYGPEPVELEVLE